MWPFRRRPPQEAPPATPIGVAGVVPCAGESSRMGRPKALLDAGGRSFLAATVGALVGGGCDPVLVVIEPGAEELKRKAEAAGALVVENPEPGRGPIASLRLALALLGDRVAGVAYLPVDHPKVSPETVAALIEAFTESNAPLVLPVHGGERGHPPIFGRALFAALMDPGLDGGARTVVHDHLEAARTVAVEDPGVLLDIDTPEDWRAAFGTGS